MSRESDINKVIVAVLETPATFEMGHCGADYFECPFCEHDIMDSKKLANKNSMNQIKHTMDCSYLIAKDLNTNLNLESNE